MNFNQIAMLQKFDKLLYKYLIKSGSVTGEQVCAIVYEQGVLPMDDSIYNGLLNGETNAFSWIKSKLESLELTPGELALEPCSAGAVVTNPNTGEVLACVSYPGYDNNRLSNVMDRPYYVQLSMGMSRTFYNRATQEKTAPGSTYKMLSSMKLVIVLDKTRMVTMTVIPVLKNWQNMQKCLDLTRRQESKFLNHNLRFLILTLFDLPLDRVPTTILSARSTVM